MKREKNGQNLAESVRRFREGFTAGARGLPERGVYLLGGSGPHLEGSRAARDLPCGEIPASGPSEGEAAAKYDMEWIFARAAPRGGKGGTLPFAPGEAGRGRGEG